MSRVDLTNAILDGSSEHGAHIWSKSGLHFRNQAGEGDKSENFSFPPAFPPAFFFSGQFSRLYPPSPVYALMIMTYVSNLPGEVHEPGSRSGRGVVGEAGSISRANCLTVLRRKSALS